jgi:hypothetical protein
MGLIAQNAGGLYWFRSVIFPIKRLCKQVDPRIANICPGSPFKIPVRSTLMELSLQKNNLKNKMLRAVCR